MIMAYLTCLCQYITKKFFTVFLTNIMKIENTSSLHFNAKFINKVNIGKLSSYPAYSSKQAYFIQIEPHCEKDIEALKDISEYWEGNNFASNIYYAVCAIKNKSKHYKNHQVFGLTLQDNNFDVLDSKKIVGLVHTCPEDNDYIFIEHIQVNPSVVKSLKPEYKGIGTGILNSLKRINDKIFCYPAKEKSVINFYIKNGFVKQQNSLNRYEWLK